VDAYDILHKVIDAQNDAEDEAKKHGDDDERYDMFTEIFVEIGACVDEVNEILKEYRPPAEG
jgi:hypothetical protein